MRGSWAKVSLCGAPALLVAYVPEHAGLSEAGRASLAIMVLAAGLWISEVLPAFAVARLAVALLWLTESLHGRRSALVAFLPILALPVLGLLRAEDLRTLPWDVLLLVAGGMCLGLGVLESGLAHWLVSHFAVAGLPPFFVSLGLAYLVAFLSNLMSNTAAANLVLPVAISLALEMGGTVLVVPFVVPVALAASSAMCLPVSTPPNALVFATGFVPVRRFLGGGIGIGLVAPPAAVAWCFAAARLGLVG